jgi:nitrate/nitrite transporter NarK
MSAVVALFVVDRFGRRNLMMFGAAGMACSLVILAGLLSANKSNLAVGAAVFLFALVYLPVL